MSRRSVVPVLFLMAIAWPVFAQESAASAPAADSAAPAPKKKGMFGKLKSIAGNKTVQSVAKVAACTMVPGGQFVAGAIDAAGHPDAGGVAAGVAGGATGAACGMGGIGTGVGGAAVAGAGMTGVPGMAGAASSVPGLAGVGGASVSTAAAVASAATMTAAMFAKPGGGGGDPSGAPGTLSAKDEKKMRSMLKKQGLTDEQIEQSMAAQKQNGQPQAVAVQQGPAPVAAPVAQPVGLPEDYDAQLKAGKLVLIDLPWKGATADLIVGTEDGVKVTFLKIVESLSYTQGTYHVDVYVTEPDKGVAASRASAIVVFLTNAGLPAEEKLGGKATTAARSKQARVELVRN